VAVPPLACESVDQHHTGKSPRRSQARNARTRDGASGSRIRGPQRAAAASVHRGMSCAVADRGR
jgi:hypothetical protein